MRNRKGIISYNVTTLIFRILFLIFALTPIIFLIRSYVTVDIDIFDSEAKIMVERILYGPHGISYTDSDTGRVYPGIVKISAISEDSLQKTFELGDQGRKVGAKVDITSKDDVSTLYINKERYEYLNTMAQAGWFRGSGGVYTRNEVHPILIMDQERTLSQGTCNITVVIQKS